MTNAREGAKTDSALTTDAWHQVVVTSDRRSGGSVSDGITSYVDGASVASSKDDFGYVPMEGLEVTTTFGHWIDSTGTATSLVDGAIAGSLLGPFFVQDKLNPLNVYKAGLKL